METTIIIKLKDENTIVTDKTYDMSGVWALWAENNSNCYICLEVGETQSIKEELNWDIDIFRTADSNVCLKCQETYVARKKYEWSMGFKVHKCKECTRKSVLRAKYATQNPRYVDKYKDMLNKYKNFEFRLVDCSLNKSSDERKKIEKEYAHKHKALYWYA